MLTLNEKSRLIIVEQSGKRCPNIFYWVKKDLFGCFRIEEIRDKANETGLKEGRRYRNVNYSASIHYNDKTSQT